MPTENSDRAHRRLLKVERERLIVDEAIRFFAEVGLDGRTRALAQRLGVTQPLLYRYFPDKESLVERVYHEVFLGGWDAAWEAALADRSVPLLDRVLSLYLNYARKNFSYERVRLFMFAGQKSPDITRRYVQHINDHLLLPLCRELRAEAGMDPEGPISDIEIETVAGLHGAVGYVGIRRWVYHVEMTDDVETIVSQLVTAFILGTPATFRGLAAN